MMNIALSTPVDLRALASHFGQPPQTIPAGLGSTATTPLVEALLARGHRVTLFTLSLDIVEEMTLRGPALTAFVCPMRKAHRARNLWKNEINALSHAIRREQPAFVHAHWTYEFAMGAVKSGVPTITTIHDLPWNVLRYFRDPYRAARLLLAYRVAWGGKRYTAVSEDAACHFRRYFRRDAEITVVPNFLPDARFVEGASTRTSSQPLTFYTVLQGWTTRKNGKAALRAFALARQNLPDARLLMMGADYQEGGPANAWACAHHLDTAVEFRGPLNYDRMLSVVEMEADILVHPSLDESFSMAALEAMALHKPVIAGRDTPGVREVLDFGRCGLLVDVRRPAAIAAAMGRLGGDPSLRRTLAAAAYTSAWERFRVTPVVMAYEAIYKDLVGKAAHVGLLEAERASPVNPAAGLDPPKALPAAHFSIAERTEP